MGCALDWLIAFVLLAICSYILTGGDSPAATAIACMLVVIGVALWFLPKLAPHVPRFTLAMTLFVIGVIAVALGLIAQ